MLANGVPLTAVSRRLGHSSVRTSEPLEDRIEVVDHLPLEGKKITDIHPVDYRSKRYLYLEDRSNRAITVVEMTDPTHPKITNHLDFAERAVSERLEIVVGEAILLAASQPQRAGDSPGTVSIVNFSDSAKPKVIRRFENVTAIKSDRGMVFITNDEGLWLLREQPARDLEAEREWDRYNLPRFFYDRR